MSAESTGEKLFAAFARRLGYIDDAGLVAACEARHRDPTRILADILVARGALDVKHRPLVEEVVKSHLAPHGGDVEACYAEILDKGWVPAALLADAPAPSTAAGTPIDSSQTGIVWEEGSADEPAETVTLGSYTSGGSRYELLERKGWGGMGEIWVARDRELNREVLLKQVLPKLAGHPQSRGNFLRETRTGAMLEHPGIVPVYDIGQHPGGQLFQVMRYFRPGSLHKKIVTYHLAHPNSLDELSFRTLLGHFATACRAIDFVHTRGIQHLDIKPTNIVTGEFGETQIIDWGLAQITDGDMLDKVNEGSGTFRSESTPGELGSRDSGATPPEDRMPRGLRGTRAYAAPEQWQRPGTTIGPRTDVYGLGATLFEILAGKAPFIPSSPTIEEDVEVGNVHHAIKPWVPAALRAICRKAMAVNPEDRHATAGALADDVDRFLADEPVAAYPDPWQVRLWRFVKRHRTAVTALAALLATTAGALAIGNVLVSRQRDRAVAAEVEAITQRDLAKNNAAMTREVIAEFIEKVADDQWGGIPGTGRMRLGAVQHVVDEFPMILAQQPDDPDLQYDAALIYRRCGNLHRLLGELDDAAPLYDRSRELMDTLIKQHPEVATYRLGWIHNLLEDAEILLRKAGPGVALPTLREALVAAERSVEQFPKHSSGALRVLGHVQLDLSDALVNAGRVEEGVKLSGESVRNFDAFMARDAADDEATRAITRLLAALASVVATNARTEADRPDEAREMAAKADRQTSELSASYGGDANVDYVRALALAQFARVLSRDAATAGKGEALEVEAVDILRRLVGGMGQEANFRPALSDVLSSRAQTLLAAGKLTEAVKIADEAIATVAPLDLPTEAAEAKRCLARAHAVRGKAAKAAGDAAGVQDHGRRAGEYYEVALAAAPENKKIREEAAEIGRLLTE